MKEKVNRTDGKTRNTFAAFKKDGTLFASGVVYEQGNVMLDYRDSIGPCAEQFADFGVFYSTFFDKIRTILNGKDEDKPEPKTLMQVFKEAGMLEGEVSIDVSNPKVKVEGLNKGLGYKETRLGVEVCGVPNAE